MNQGVRRFLGVVFLAAGLVTLGVGLWRQHAAAAMARPHPLPRLARSLVLVTLDTTRADHLGPYGARDVETATLDRLAREGVVFEHAYSVAPITVVAHTSIMTGLEPPAHGVRNNGLHYVPAELTTLAERLRAGGLRTAAFVSAAVLEKRYGLDQGFETYDDDLSSGRERHPRQVPDRPAEATVAAAGRWLGGLGPDEPFFLWVHFYDPHASYSPPPPYRDRYRERLYDGEIAYMDAQLGVLLAHPRLAGKAGERVVVSVIGDHGESLGEHGEQTHAILAYDATLRIPWILRAPGAPAGLRLAPDVGQVDLLPTALDLLGLRAEAGLAGRSLVPMLEGAPPGPDRLLYAETYLPSYTYGWAKLRVLRQGRWKLIEAPVPELYDLRRDPRELADQAPLEPGRTHDMERELRTLVAAAGDAERETVLPLDSEQAEKLRSLGYLAVGSPRPPRASRPNPRDMIALHVGLEAARQLMQDRLFADAERRLRSVLARDPDNLSGLMDLALALANQGAVDEAVRVAEKAAALDPTYARLQLLLADLEGRRGGREQALRLVDRALALDPRSIEARLQKARTLVSLQRPAEARDLLLALRRDEPENPLVALAFAQIVDLPRGDLPGAEARLRQALARDPFLVQGWRLLGEAEERAGKTREAARSYEDGLRRQPDDADLHARLGLVLARLGERGAEAHLGEAIRLGPEFRSELHVALGAWLAEHGRFQEAQREYARVLAVEPGNPAARNNRAIAYYRTGRLEEAMAEWKQLLAEVPDHADALNNLAAACLDRSQWSAAESYARRSLALQPKAAEAWNNLGIAQDSQGHHTQALESFRRALDLDASYWPAHNNLATTLSKSGRAREAAAAFEEVLQQVPAQPEAHLELGDLYAGPLADPARARSHYNAFLRNAPSHRRAADVRRRLARLEPPPHQANPGP